MIRVLIVDDHILFREGLATLLSNQPDFKIVGEAGSVQEAVEAAEQSKPDLILMDYGLSDGTGLEAMQAILARQPQAKVVFLTIHESLEYALEAILHGARGYLAKNIAISKLVAALRGLERGELAISRSLISRLIDHLLRVLPHDHWEYMIESRLTRREWEVLRLLGTGASNQEIAKRLFISENTVKIHVHNLLDKLKLKDRRDAARYARTLGLVSSTAEASLMPSLPVASSPSPKPRLTASSD